MGGDCPEGLAVAAPAVHNSVERLPGGTSGSGQDTDDNSADFQGLSPSVPRNSSSPAATPPSSLGNVRATLFLTEGATTTELEWAAAAGATGYHVYRGTTPGFMGASPAPWQSPAVNAETDINQPSPVFFYVVLATDGSSVSED